MLSPSGVESTTSQKTIVTVLRISRGASGGAASGFPQARQYRARAGLASPHVGQGAMSVSEFRPQNARKYTVALVFDTLSDRLQSALGDVRGRGKLDEESVSKAMREIRLALLEADVNFKVVKDFVARVKARSLGLELTKGLTPGQQVVKIVHEELTDLMGSGGSKIAFAGRPPTVILLVGPPGRGEDDCRREARAAPAQGRAHAAPRRRRPAAAGRRRSASAARKAAPGPRLHGV